MSTNAVLEAATGTAKRQFCTFWVAGRLYGVDITDVKEVNAECEFTPVFLAPPEVKGYVNIRGHIHLIIDLCTLLGFKSIDKTDSSRIVLFKPDVGDSFGVFVDRVGDVVAVAHDNIEIQSVIQTGKEELAENPAIGIDLTAGVCKLDKELMVILNAGKVLAAMQAHM